MSDTNIPLAPAHKKQLKKMNTNDRPEFLRETTPYFRDPDVAILQTPQFFRHREEQTWVEKGAGVTQELFYRMVQVSMYSLFDRMALHVVVRHGFPGGLILYWHSRPDHRDLKDHPLFSSKGRRKKKTAKQPQESQG